MNCYLKREAKLRVRQSTVFNLLFEETLWENLDGCIYLNKAINTISGGRVMLELVIYFWVK